MNPILERELQKLEISEKEAKVYLAALELGPQPVQDISRKSGVNRATTYVMIESLTQRGLMTSFDRGKKKLFAAEPPDRLLSIIRMKERELQEKEREFTQVLPELRAILASAGERPRVRFFEGAEGLRAIREEVLATDAKEMWMVAEFGKQPMVLDQRENIEFDRRLHQKGVRAKVIYTGPQIAPAEQHFAGWEFRWVPKERVPVAGEVTIFGNKIFAFTHHGKLIGAAIESAEIAGTLRAIMSLAWLGAEHVGGAIPPGTPPVSPP